MQTIRIGLPTVRGPIPETGDSEIFSTMRHAVQPLDLGSLGYLEEEYFQSGTAELFRREGASAIATGDTGDYCTRLLVRRPAGRPSGRVWLSILNASQGYDIEDDWRRAWDHIIARGDTYVGLSCKPINADALHNVDPQRYAELHWAGPLPGLAATQGWDPFQVLPGSREGLAWAVIAQTAAWLRSGTGLPGVERVYLMGQSQSGVYTNTYLTFFDTLLAGPEGGRLFDGYLPGASSTFCRELDQGVEPSADSAAGQPSADSAALPLVRIEPAQLDVPVIVVSSDADVTLFGGRPDDFLVGDGPLRRHWQVAGAPHSDARSRVIPENAQIERAHRLGREITPEFLQHLSVLPLEPVITAAMVAIDRWVTEGVPAAPSCWFATDGDGFVRDSAGVLEGGIRLGLLEHPLAHFGGADPHNAIYGWMDVYGAAEALSRYENLTDYQTTCDAVDDQLEREGYLEPQGRRLLHRVEQELWERSVNGQPAARVTPQDPS